MIIAQDLVQAFDNSNAGCLKPQQFTRNSPIRIRTKASELQDYEIGQVIGEGGFGFVRKATHLPTGQTVAVKICPLSSYDNQQLKALQQQIDVQRHILHQNIAQVYEVINTNSKIYIFMEYCKNGELFDRINKDGPLPQNQAAKIFHQILSALIYLRQNNLSHRDIKPQNILFDKNWKVKLIDFGFSCVAEQGQFRRTVCGTPSYMPPEILKKVSYESQIADVWSLGVTLYAMLAAKLPFDSDTPQKRKLNILSLKYSTEPNFSQRAQKLISSIFVQAKYRPKLQDLLKSQFALYFPARPARSVNFKNQSIELETEVLDALVKKGYSIETLTQSVKRCKFDKYRALYFLTLKGQQQIERNQRLSCYKKHKKHSMVKLNPISNRTPTVHKKSASLAPQDLDLIQIKRTILIKNDKNKQKNRVVERPNPLSLNNSRLRKNSIDSPRRLIDCLSAYKFA